MTVGRMVLSSCANGHDVMLERDESGAVLSAATQPEGGPLELRCAVRALLSGVRGGGQFGRGADGATLVSWPATVHVSGAAVVLMGA
jgi:hypothetical protein